MSGETILVVEDHEDVRMAVRMSLAMSGYNVVEASSAEEALEALGRPPDLVLLDLTLPRMTGFELLEKIRSSQDLDGTAVIVASGHAGGDVARKARELGATGFLTKPFNVEELDGAVRRALESKGEP